MGVLMIGVLVGLFALAAAFYAQAFRSTVPVTLVANRAGLVMAPGNDVKLRGISVGEVTAIQEAGGDAVLSLGLDPDRVADIPANVTAQIVPATLFGTKYVALSEPERPSRARIAANAVLRNESVTVEVNNVFDNLAMVLNSVDPAKINATLGEIALALDGRGDEIAGLASNANAYLARINGKLPTLRRDLVALADVTQIYAGVAPDVLRVLDNATASGHTIVDQAEELDAFLLDVTTLGQVGREVLAQNQHEFITALEVLRPTTGLLRAYEPGLTCFIEGLDYTRQVLEPALGGVSPELRLATTLTIGQKAYEYPRDLPKVEADNPPACYGLPVLEEHERPSPYVPTDTGTNPNASNSNEFAVEAPPFELLFGPPRPGSSPATTTGGAR
ncbi:MCE family protein [Pseudonocardia sp. T1-2H]|uniref:MCE family protein n=1 Tax=Pseudonocardia sp. T1-2H TaxID=3128899 RepID=UPI003101294D